MSKLSGASEVLSLTPGESGEATTAVSEILECPVCLCTPKSIPIYQCSSNGHVVCSSCVGKLGKICPICRDRSGFSRCLTAEKLLVKYLKNPEAFTFETTGQPCIYASHGCPEKASNSSHIKACNYRLLCCPYFTCNLQVPANKLIKDHIPKDHEDIRTVTLTEKMIFRLCVRDEHWESTTSYKPVRFVFNGFEFFRAVRRNNEKKCWQFWVYFNGLDHEAGNMKVEIQLLDFRKEIVLSFKDELIPLDESWQQVVNDCRGLVVMDELMRRRVVHNDEFYMALSVKRNH